jgi:hypothetical protein
MREGVACKPVILVEASSPAYMDKLSGGNGAQWNCRPVQCLVGRICCMHERMHRGLPEHLGGCARLLPKRHGDPSHPQII